MEADVSLTVSAPSGANTIQVSSEENQSYKVTFENQEKQGVPVGKFHFDTKGYVELKIQGVSKTGLFYGNVNSVELANYNGTIHIAKDGRKNGPAVHMWYDLQGIRNGEYFYNEVLVPELYDEIIKAYFMVCGFTGGYFGSQHNSNVDRGILFSIWSPFDTNDPKSIPEEDKIKLLKQGPETHVNDFGNEGSGAQSYINYGWKAGVPIKCLVKITPDKANNTTDYTAWYADSADDVWHLVASFKRPKTSVNVEGAYSFSENFDGEQGCYERKVLYGQQWIRDTDGKWHELTNGTFTADASAISGSQMDYSGGVEGEKFFLRNCGFFSDRTQLDSKFQRKATAQEPNVDLENLP